MPPVSVSHRPPTTWPLKGLAWVLLLVLGVHLWLLGGKPVHWLWPDSGTVAEPTPLALSTRVLPPEIAPAPAAAPKPVAAKPRRPTLPAAKAQATHPTEATEAPIPVAPAPESSAATTAPATDTATSIPTQVPASSAPDAPDAPVAAPSPRYAFPPPVQMNYDVSAVTNGRKDVGGASIVWTHDGTNYQASLVATKFGLKLRQWSSKGALTATGLAPVRFGEKGWRRSEVAAHFVRDQGKISFSANTPDAPLLAGTQDNLSVFMQLASLWAGDPQRYAAGESITFQTVGPRQVETWTFAIAAEENITVPGGAFRATKLTREATGDYSTKAEIWLAPQLAYLPAHIRLSETNGNVLDMVWTDSQQP